MCVAMLQYGVKSALFTGGSLVPYREHIVLHYKDQSRNAVEGGTRHFTARITRNAQIHRGHSASFLVFGACTGLRRGNCM